MDDIYRRQIAPQDATSTLPFARPEAFGAGAAAAVGQAANQTASNLIRGKAKETALERDKQANAAALQFARIQEEANQYALEQQQSSELGGEGYTRSIEAWMQDREAQFLGSIGDERVRGVMATRFADWRAGSMASAQAWESGQSVRLAVDNYQEVTDIRANQAGRSDAAGFDNLLKEQREDIEMMEGINDQLAQKLLRGGIEQISIGFLQGQPPADRKKLLASGLFDGLDPAAVKRIKDGADVDLRRERLELEAAQRVRRAEALDEINQLLDDAGDGLPVSAEALASAEGLAKDLGLDRKQKDLFDARVVVKANEIFQDATPAQIDAAVKDLNSKISKAGTNAKRQDVVMRDHLVGLRQTRAAMIAADPAEFGSRIGIDWQPLALDDPEALPSSIDARIRAAELTATQTGTPVKYLQAAEADALAANLGTRQGKESLINIAQMFGAARGDVLRQVAPDEHLLMHVSGLGVVNRSYALEGAELLETKVYKAPSDLDEMIRERLGATMLEFGPDARRGVMETARALYARQMSKRGDLGEEVDEGVVAILVDRALGNGSAARGDAGGAGGLAVWRGDARFILPPEMTAAEFGRRIGGVKGVKGMFWPDGQTPITPAQLVSRFRPRAIGGSRYVWVDDAGNYARLKDGNRAVLDVAKLADRGEPSSTARPQRSRADEMADRYGQIRY